MKLFSTLFLTFLILCTLVSPALSKESAEEQECCQKIMHNINTLDNTLAKDMHRIKRELAALKKAQNSPGLQEIFAGIGYICGLFGVAFFIAGRRNNTNPNSDTKLNKME